MIGQTVGNYEILDKIGEGGMGVVYRARDVRLDRLVALKFLSLEMVSNRELKRRFIQEAKAASALDHRNICTIHAIDETPEGQLFIAMAYYEGETVKAKMRRGLMSAGEIVDVGAQVAAGLAAAHELGIIHLDVKPANLIVTRDGTVKILDFGLSRFTSQVSEHSHSGPLMGTVAYMSPERVKGEKAGPESDIWSLGVVLYEMATGTRPFQGGSDMSVLYAVVHREFVPPNERVPDLPDELDRIIRRTLVKDRRYRYRSLTHLAVDIESLQASQSLTATVPWIYHRPWRYGSRPKRIAAGLLAVAVVLILIGGVTWMTRQALYGGGLGQGSEVLGPQRVLVAGIRNLGDSQLDWTGVALAELLWLELPSDLELAWSRPENDPLRLGFPDLVEQLGSGKGFRARALEPLQLDSYGVVGSGTLSPGDGGAVAVEIVVQSSIDARVIDTINGEGSVEDLPALASWLAARLPRKLGINPPRVTEIDPGMPSDPGAVRALLRVRDYLRLLEGGKARSLLEKALEAEPDNVLLRLALVDTLEMLGRLEEAGEKAELAFAAARDSSLKIRADAWLRILGLQREGQRAAALAQALWRHEQDPLRWVDRGIQLAILLSTNNHNVKALEVLAVLEEKDPEDPRIPYRIAKAASDESRSQQLEASGRAIALAQKRDAPLIAANALRLEGEAYLWGFGDLAEARARFQRALEVFVREGDDYNRAKTLNSLGLLSAEDYDLVAAKSYHEEGARLAGALGDRRLRSRMLINSAFVLRDRGLYRAAIDLSYQALEELQHLKDPVAAVVCRYNIIEGQWKTGQFSAAQQSLEEMVEMLADLNNPGFESQSLALYGRFLTLNGNLDEAGQQLDRALAMQQDDLGNQILLAHTLHYQAGLLHLQGDLEGSLAKFEQAGELLVESRELSRVETGKAEVLIDMGRLQEAQEHIEKALEVQDSLSDPSWAAQSRIVRIRSWILEERFAEAVDLAESVLSELNRSDVVLEKAQTYSLLAQGYLGLNEPQKAQEVNTAAAETLSEIPSPVFRLPVQITAALIQANNGDADGASDELERLLALATAQGFRGRALEIELALGETGSRGRAHVLDLAKSADVLGYRLIADKARSLAAYR